MLFCCRDHTLYANSAVCSGAKKIGSLGAIFVCCIMNSGGTRNMDTCAEGFVGFLSWLFFVFFLRDVSRSFFDLGRSRPRFDFSSSQNCDAHVAAGLPWSNSETKLTTTVHRGSQVYRAVYAIPSPFYYCKNDPTLIPSTEQWWSPYGAGMRQPTILAVYRTPALFCRVPILVPV